ncbi:MAG: hypothetical protein K0U66_04260 [Gammaproteobacteria bacterium]|nr:hypothetical protein [Gammaproteobacteria bacterium]
MNANSILTYILVLIGITASPTNVGGGLFWVLAIYLVSMASAYGDPATRWGWRSCGWIALIAFGMALFGAVVQPAVPFVRDMPVEGAVGLFGGIYPACLTMPKGIRKLARDICLVIAKKAS